MCADSTAYRRAVQGEGCVHGALNKQPTVHTHTHTHTHTEREHEWESVFCCLSSEGSTSETQPIDL